MRLADLLGIPIEEHYEPADEGEPLTGDIRAHYFAMVRGAALFLRGGGVFSATDWCGFSMLEQQAAAKASQIAWQDRGRQFARGFESEADDDDDEDEDPVEGLLEALLDGLP